MHAPAFKLPKRVDAILFDVFGTLCSIGERKHPLLKLAKLAQNPRRAIEMAMTRNMTIEDMVRYVNASAKIRDDLETELQIEVSSISLFPDADTALRDIRAGGIKIGLVSNLASPYAQPAVGCLPVKPTACIWSFETGLLKPDKRIFDLACQELTVDVQHTVMVGDSHACDCVGASSAGIRAVLLDRSGRPHLEFDSISSLDQLLPAITSGE